MQFFRVEMATVSWGRADTHFLDSSESR